MTVNYRVQLVLADRGNLDKGSGGLNLLNAGWSWTQAPPGSGVSMCLAAIVEVPWDRCNKDLSFTLQLVTDDREPVRDDAGAAIVITQTLRVAPRSGAPAGASGVGTVLVEIPSPGLSLPPRAYYHWVAAVDHFQNDQWQATFWVDGPAESPAVS
ncbi:MAG: hypothetical protein NTX29_05745 [Actinobacteria bacterium]|nr:hypothetical protein [Actinomycetota bacterium]